MTHPQWWPWRSPRSHALKFPIGPSSLQDRGFDWECHPSLKPAFEGPPCPKLRRSEEVPPPKPPQLSWEEWPPCPSIPVEGPLSTFFLLEPIVFMTPLPWSVNFFNFFLFLIPNKRKLENSETNEMNKGRQGKKLTYLISLYKTSNHRIRFGTKGTSKQQIRLYETCVVMMAKVISPQDAFLPNSSERGTSQSCRKKINITLETISEHKKTKLKLNKWQHTHTPDARGVPPFEPWWSPHPLQGASPNYRHIQRNNYPSIMVGWR